MRYQISVVLGGYLPEISNFSRVKNYVPENLGKVIFFTDLSKSQKNNLEI